MSSGKNKILLYKLRNSELPTIDSIKLNSKELCIDSNQNSNSLYKENSEECGENIGESNWPWHVQIMKRNDALTTICYGTIVSNNYILTSYNCVKSKERPEQFIVTLANSKQIGVIQVKTPNNYLYDIVLLKLEEHIVFDDVIKAVCFPQPDMNFSDNGYVRFTT